ncbi:MAG: very short patch repair endonuclease [Burkholderiales bacterium]
MSDVHSAAIRSKNMRAIKNKDTRPEILIRQALHARGLRFRLHVKTLPGTPDIVLPKFKAVVFVNGCFWHGHKCPLCKIPKTRADFWQTKIKSNHERDIISASKLTAEGWRIAIVWECALKGRQKLTFDVLVDRLSQWIADPLIQTIEFKGTDIEGIQDT